MTAARLDIETTAYGDTILVRPIGVLDLASAPVLRETLMKAIADQPAALLVDLDRLEVPAPHNLSLFTLAARRAAEWSGLPFVLIASDRAGAQVRLHTRAIARYLPICTTREAAIRQANEPPQRRITRLRLASHPHAATVARRLALATCDIWGVPDLAEDAGAVASELATNAVEHTVGESEMRLELRGGSMTVVLGDSNPMPPVMRPAPTQPRAGGYGLWIIDALANSWGWAPNSSGGKVVWAVLSSRQVQPLRAVRRE